MTTKHKLLHRLERAFEGLEYWMHRAKIALYYARTGFTPIDLQPAKDPAAKNPEPHVSDQFMHQWLAGTGNNPTDSVAIIGADPAAPYADRTVSRNLDPRFGECSGVDLALDATQRVKKPLTAEQHKRVNDAILHAAEMGEIARKHTAGAAARARLENEEFTAFTAAVRELQAGD